MISYTIRSQNAKTGKMLVTSQSKETCPPDCPFNRSGCYGDYGPLSIHWSKVSEGKRIQKWADFLGAVRDQKPDSLWRMSQVGDLPGKGNRIDARKLRDVIEANRGRRGFTFTHKKLTPTNRALIAEANANGFTINLSTHSVKEADRKAALGIAPVVMAIPEDPKRWPDRTPNGRPIVICLAETKGLTCKECGLCQVARRRSIVAFPAHGTGKRIAEKALS